MEHGSTQVEFTPQVFSNCMIVLDDPANSIFISKSLSVTNLIFKNCTVIYRGGPIIFTPLTGMSITINGHRKDFIPSVGQKPEGKLGLIDCLIVLDFSQTPSPFGQDLTKNVLIAGNNPVFIKAFGS